MITDPIKFFQLRFVTQVTKYLAINNIDDFLIFVTFLFVFLILISGLFRLLLVWFTSRLGNLIGSDFSSKIYSSALYQPYSLHINRNSSEIISGVSSKVSMIINMIIIPIFNIFSSLIVLIFFFISFLIVDPLIFLIISIGFSSIYFFIVLFVKNKLVINSFKLNLELTLVTKVLQEGLGGIRDIIIDGTQELYISIFKKSDIAARKAQSNISLFSVAPRYIVETFGIVFISLIAFYLTKNQTEGENIVVMLGVLVLGAFRIMPFLQQLYGSWASVQGGKSLFYDVYPYLEYRDFSQKKLNKTAIQFNKSIKFNSVCFNYSPNSPNVLDNISFEISKGDRIGIIGSTGSGKSTILNILMGLLFPTKGKILIDDVPLEESNIGAWQSHISHVPQAIYLSDSTIAENIAFGILKSDIDFKKIIEVAGKAKILDFIETLPEKFNTFVGEQGVRLSGGQRQRIGIARALYKNSDLLVLDEATSALDNSTENDIMDSIKYLNNDLTIVIVAHRLTTLVDCNKIIEIGNGKVIKFHNYKDLA